MAILRAQEEPGGHLVALSVSSSNIKFVLLVSTFVVLVQVPDFVFYIDYHK